MSLLIGLSKSEITCLIPGIGMMGYGWPDNFAKEIGTPLWARTVIIEKSNLKKFILVHLELAFVSIAVREEVLKTLSLKFPEWQLTHADLLITANHTHSAPGGYSHYPFYNFSIPGFNNTIFNKIVTGIIESIESAVKNMAPSTLEWGERLIPEDREVAFNRSIKAFLNNKETPRLKETDTHLAIDRNMKGLKIFDQSGKLRGLINWFAVHATSISNLNHKIHHDNKGVAAALFEKNYPGTIAIFAQTHAGDVSPNFRWDPKTKRMRGKYLDQYQDVEFNGEIQFRESEKITPLFQLNNQIESYHAYFDLSIYASPAAHGTSFIKGTLEGPGVKSSVVIPSLIGSKVVRAFRLLRGNQDDKDFYAQQDPKNVVFDHRNGTVIGIPVTFWKKFKYLPDPLLESFRKDAASGSLNTLPWVPHVIPFQLTRIDKLLIASVPGEMTTTAGRRLKEYLLQNLKEYSLKDVVIAGYSNGYMGYVTTPEEYELQFYEGGHTIYGKNTLPAIMKCFDQLISQMKVSSTAVINNTPFKFPDEELKKRSAISL